MKKILSSLILILSSVFLITNVYSAAFEGISILPKNYDPKSPLTSSWFIYNLVPGETKKDTVVIYNRSNKTVRFKIYAVDATTTRDGAFALKMENEEKKGVGAWVKLSREKVELPPNSKIEVPFTITIPKNAKVGDHVGGIVIEDLDFKPTSGINVKVRLGVRIYETVPGELIKKLSVENLRFYQDKGKLYLVFNLKNEGNVKLEPKAEIELTSSFYKAKQNVSLRMVLPEKPTEVPVEIKNPPLIGKIKAKVKVKYGDKPTEMAVVTASTFFINKKLKLLGLAALIFLVLTLLKTKSRKR